jgi:hypothetical protein
MCLGDTIGFSCLKKFLRPTVKQALCDPLATAQNCDTFFARSPAKTMRIFSSEEYECQVLQRMFLTTLSAARFDLCAFFVISIS